MKVAVVIGRFQIDSLHKGYKDMLSHISKENDLIVFLIGTTVVKNCTKDPLDFLSRKMMVQTFCNTHQIKCEIFPLPDIKDDTLWVKKMEELIIMTHGFDDIILYGSRDSFLTCYQENNGKFPVQLFEEKTQACASDRRAAIAQAPENHEKFRAGMIYAAYNRYPISFTTVDALVLHNHPNGKKFILLGRKPNENKWRLPGGFVDPTDENLEAAVLRELEEETKITAKQIESTKYIGSFRVDDWRYKDRQDKIMTNVILCMFKRSSSVGIVASDDLAEVKWFEIVNNDITINLDNIISEHYEIMKEIRRIGFDKLLKN